MARLLTDFLRASAGRRFEWGRLDCGLWLADWVLACRGFDPAAEVRGRYSTAEEFAAYAGRGGALRVIARQARRAGLARTSDPSEGDIVVVAAPWGATGAIRTRRGFAMLEQAGGICIAPRADVLAAWSLSCLKPSASRS